jgi:hypothetical protein
MGILDEMKEVADLVKKIGDIDLYRKIVKLEGEVIDLTRSNRSLEERVGELQRAMKFAGELTFKGSFYWQKDDPNPYCAGCWDQKRLAVHLTRVRLPQMGDQMQCPVCKSNYGRVGTSIS